jgi:arsenite methyltransferase
MGSCNAYESKTMNELLGDTLRPGGLELTEKAITHCALAVGMRVLDLGCGRGATTNLLSQKHGLVSVGIDSSENLLAQARENYQQLEFLHGYGEELPFEEESFHAVFAECVLSLMQVDVAIRETSRVLKSQGWLVLSDVYARNTDAVKELDKLPFNSCMRGLHNLEVLQARLLQCGFEIVHCEDCTQYLKELLVKIVFSYGSMGIFWNKTTGGCTDGEHFQRLLKACKPGYFLLVARKGGHN